jgi:UDP-N-acetylmuramoyl-L-alanyl-D-glutamate--2,6-diaminopimelate ligase
MKSHTISLNNLLAGIASLEIKGEMDLSISGLSFNSATIKKGDLFIAIKGHKTDGHFYVDQAIANGCHAVLLEQRPWNLKAGVTYILVKDSKEALGLIASRFYGDPSKHISLIGVTGTNGKTTLVTLLHGLFQNLGFKTGLLSTVQNKIDRQIFPSALTTPDVITTNQLLAQMVEQGCSYAFMEVSSHAIDQKRIFGLKFTGGIFTNITHDHLDYHPTFSDYLYTKKKFFDQLDTSAFTLVNLDDKNGRIMAQNTKSKVYSYAIQSMADFRARVLANSLHGLQLEIGGKHLNSKLIGDFNAMNLLAVYSTGLLLGQNEIEILTELSKLEAPEGRFNHWINPSRNITGIVDYAHTPDALEKIITSIIDLKPKHSKLITVVGCGGDRDQTKRPLMGKIAAMKSDWAIFTSDNPRSEDPELIIRQMGTLLNPVLEKRVIRLVDRKAAIELAVKLATQGDIILVAGKGHEKYQEIKGKQYVFDDKAELENALWAL